MSDYSELNARAQAAIDELAESGQRWPEGGDWFEPELCSAELEFVKASTPQVIRALIAENERLAGCDKAYAEAWQKARSLQSEMDALMAENEALRKRIDDMSPFKGAPQTGPDTKCLACGGYHYGMSGLPCPKMTPVAQALSMENQRITPVVPLRVPHPLDAAMDKGEQPEIHHTSWALVHETPPTCAGCGVQMFSGLTPSKFCKGCQLD